MNKDKSQRLLRKVQALFDNLSEQSHVSSLERDLLLSYLRDLYEEISTPQEKLPVIDKPLGSFETYARKTEPEQVSIPKEKETLHVREEAPVHHIKEPIQPVAEKIAERPQPVQRQVEEKVPVEKYTPVVVKEILVAEGPAKEALVSLFEFREAGELAEKLKLQPIEKIEHGMGINERILTINELFNGDSELFKKTVAELENLRSFNDARDYLTEGVATRFEWATDKKKPKAAYFIQLVRRRYAGQLQ
jgi:hypothetical protein